MVRPWLYVIARPFIVMYTKIKFKPLYINNKSIPKKGGIILAGNHPSKSDPVIMATGTRRYIIGLGKEELFKSLPGRIIFTGLGAIPINRQGKDDTIIPRCVQLLKKGACIGVMPEGTINRTDEIIMPFKTGAVRMAIGSGCQIIPFAIIGKPINNYRKKKKRPTIIFGDAYHPSTDDIVKETKILEDKVIELLKQGVK
jgi:1-acyl-sn-glycerol-3-phosphate acyltransferase